jgi:hypothetical protein
MKPTQNLEETWYAVTCRRERGGIATTPRRVHIKDPITLADCNNTLNTNGHFSLWLFSSSFPRFYFPSYSEKVIQRTMF